MNELSSTVAPQEAGAVEPSIVQRSEHTISRRDICPYALKVLYRLLQNGHVAYLVGGGVRDLLLGHQPKDFDVSTDASPGQLKRLFRNCWLIGRRFRLAHIRYGEVIIETATFRRQPREGDDENTGGEGENPSETEDLYVHSDNRFGTPCEDAFRRDFTINGLFYDVGSFAVIDYVGGLKDLEKKVIRCIGDPNIRFREDPVRMLRAVRFASRLRFKIEKDTHKAILDHREELSKASPARLMEEMGRFFGFGSGEAAMRLLYKTGLLSGLIPAVARYLDGATLKEKNRYWSYLNQLDQYNLKQEKMDLTLVFAVLIYPVLFPKQEEGRSLHDEVEQIKDFGQGFNECLNFPRKLRESLNQLLFSQLRLQMKNGRRFRRRKFASRPGFDLVLTLTRFVVEVDGIDPKPLEEWSRLREEVVANRESEPEETNEGEGEGEGEGAVEVPEGASTEGKRPSGRRSRRRNRRKRGEQEPDLPVSAPEGEASELTMSGPVPDLSLQQTPSPSDGLESVPEASVVAGEVPSSSGSRRRRNRKRKRRTPGEESNRVVEHPAAPDLSSSPVDNPSLWTDPAATAEENSAEEQEINFPADPEEENSPSLRGRERERGQRRRRSASQVRQFGRDDTPILHRAPLGEQEPDWLDEI